MEMYKLYEWLPKIADTNFLTLIKNTFDKISDMIFLMEVCDDTIRYILANQSALHTLGFTGEIYGKSIDEVLPEGRLEIIRTKYYQTIERKKTVIFEEEFYANDVHMIGETYLIPVFFMDSNYKYILAIIRDVTDRYNKERELKVVKHRAELSEKQLRSLIEHNSDGVFVVNIYGELIQVNDNLAKITGYRKEELLNKPIITFLESKDVKKVMKIFHKPKKGKAKNFIITAIHKKGHKIILSIKSIPMVVEGEVVGGFGVIKDVTKEIENQLKTKRIKKELELIWNNTNDVIFTIGQDGSILNANPALKNLLGWSLKEVKGLSRPPFLYNFSELDHLALLDMLKQGKSIPYFETERIQKDGTIKDVLASYRAVNRGNILAVGMYKDITEQKKVQKKLQASEERYRNLIEFYPEAIAVQSFDKLVYINPTGIKLIGAKNQNEIIGKAIWEFIIPEKREFIKRKLTENLQDQTIVEKEPIFERIVRCDGKIICTELIVLPINYEDKLSIQIIIKDVTEKKKYEEKLEFLAFHDPLTGLVNRRRFAEVIEQSIKEANMRKESLAVMYLDIDKFKEINDSLGHEIGDKLLKAISKRLQANARESDVLSRVGGDEFLLLIKDIDLANIKEIAERFLNALQKPYLIQNHILNVTSSIGISIFPKDGNSLKTLIRTADIALYKAKEKRNHYSFYHNCF